MGKKKRRGKENKEKLTGFSPLVKKTGKKSELYLSAFRILTIFKDRVQKHSVRKTESWLRSVLLNSQILFQFPPP